jgi:hypothetical protein
LRRASTRGLRSTGIGADGFDIPTIFAELVQPEAISGYLISGDILRFDGGGAKTTLDRIWFGQQTAKRER